MDFVAATRLSLFALLGALALTACDKEEDADQSPPDAGVADSGGHEGFADSGTDAEVADSGADLGAVDGGPDASVSFEGLACTPGDPPPDNGYFKRTRVDIEGTDLQLSSVLGTGDMICYRNVDPDLGPLGEFMWKRTWGTDFGAIDDEYLMNMTITVDNNFSADGIIFVEDETYATRRTYRRGDPIPCQPDGVDMPEFIVPHGDPALLGQSYFIKILYQQTEEGGVEPNGREGRLDPWDTGLFYWDHALEALYPVADDRDGSQDPVPAEFVDRHEQSYECKRRWRIPSALCGADGTDCTWSSFELLMASDRVDKALFRGTYLVDGEDEQRSGLFLLSVTRTPTGDTERLSFPMTAVVDTGDSPAVPEQVAGVHFETVTDAWINRAGVVVFTAAYGGAGAQGDHGIYTVHEGVFHRILDNRVVADGELRFRRFGGDLEELPPGYVDDSARTRATTNVFINNAGVSELGNVFFTATLHAVARGRDSGLFVAEPRLSEAGELSYEVRNLVESGKDTIAGNALGFFCGPFNSIAANDRNQVVFKSLRIIQDGPEFGDRALNEPSNLFFYDGSGGFVDDAPVSLITIPPDAHPSADHSQELSEGAECETPDLWVILSAYAINTQGSFLFRAGCLNTGNITAWSVFRVDPKPQ